MYLLDCTGQALSGIAKVNGATAEDGRGSTAKHAAASGGDTCKGPLNAVAEESQRQQTNTSGAEQVKEPLCTADSAIDAAKLPFGMAGDGRSKAKSPFSIAAAPSNKEGASMASILFGQPKKEAPNFLAALVSGQAKQGPKALPATLGLPGQDGRDTAGPTVPHTEAMKIAGCMMAGGKEGMKPRVRLLGPCLTFPCLLATGNMYLRNHGNGQGLAILLPDNLSPLMPKPSQTWDLLYYLHQYMKFIIHNPHNLLFMRTFII